MLWLWFLPMAMAQLPSDMPSLVPSAPPSDMPSLLPVAWSDMPSIVPTEIPSESPISPPTSSPTTESPTSSPVEAIEDSPVTGQVVILLQRVSSTMEPSVQESFNLDMTAFYLSLLGPNSYSNIVAVIESQALLTRRRLRNLQTLSELEVLVNVQAQGPPGDFNSLLVSIVQSNEAFLIDLLQDSNSIKSRTYFSSVNDVTASLPGFPAGATASSSNDLEAGAVIGIVVGVLLIVGLVGGGGFFWYKTQSSSKSTVARPVVEAPTIEQQDTNRPAFKSQPSSYSLDDTQSYANVSLANQSMGLDNMSFAYSLDAGNMDANTIVTGIPPANTFSASQSVVSDYDTVDTSRRMVQREVVAPPGKLGIVIDTTLEGPVVHKVNDQSPLEGILFPGDIIISIDNVDTRAMTASAITSLMVQTAKQRRKLRVLSEDTTVASRG